MKKTLIFGAVALSLLGLTACTPDKEYKMNIIEIVEDNTGNHLAYCEPAKTFKLKHYVDVPELEDYSQYTTFIAMQAREKTSYLVNDKKVNNGKYEFFRWGV